MGKTIYIKDDTIKELNKAKSKILKEHPENNVFDNDVVYKALKIFNQEVQK